VNKKTDKPRKQKKTEKTEPRKKKSIKPIRILEKFPVRFGFGFVLLKPVNSNRTEPVHVKRKDTINEKKMLYILT
jgi:hypothetical protein